MAASLYEPIQVYKPLAPDIGVVDGPFEYFAVAGVRMPIPFTTRMTVIRLADGALFLHSPIAFDDRLAADLTRIGPIRHLVSPNQWHYAHVGEWQRAFPDAVVWGSRAAERRARARHIPVRFTRYLEASPPPEWSTEIDQAWMPGGIFGETIFFHRASATLILTDTIISLERSKVDQPWFGVARLTGMTAPRGGLFFGLRLPLLFMRRKAKAAFATIRSWRPRRIVLAHGKIIEDGAEEVVERVFR
jgi:hypothetical protein